MIPFRLIRSGVLLAGLMAALGASLHAAEGGFTATLSAGEREAAGLNMLNADELATLDQLVADDLARARELRVEVLPGSLVDRHPADLGHAAGLGHLTPEQLAKLDRFVAGAIADRPLPKERPRLRDSYLLSEQGRLRVHGGMSITVGGGSGGSFHGSSAWVSYYDPVTGLGLSFGFSQMSGNGLYDFYPGYGYGPGYGYAPVSYYSATPRLQFARPSADRTSTPAFIRGEPFQTNASGRGPNMHAGRDERL